MRTIALLLTLLLFVSACATTTTQTQSSGEFQVAATFFPLYDMTSKVAGDSAQVFSVVPLSGATHGFEPTPSDILQLTQSDAFVVMGIEFEEFEEELIESSPNLPIIKAAAGIDLISVDGDEEDEHHDDEDEHGDEEHEEDGHNEGEEEHEDESHDEDGDDHHDDEDTHEDEEHDEDEDSHDHAHSGVDPHIWLSPKNMITVAQNIQRGLMAHDAANAQSYQVNGDALVTELAQLDNEFKQGLATCSKDVVLVSHNAFSYLARDYGFTTISISGLEPESEPTPRQIQELVEAAEEHDLKYIFYEDLVDPRVSQVIASEVGAQTLELNPLENNPDSTKDYFSLMRDNLANLKIALECE